MVFFPLTLPLLLWMGVRYSVRMFGITAGYHRYFSHRSYRLGRLGQFLMAFLGQTSGQKGVLWWAAQHREHHRHSDGERDVHSPVQRGFWWSHVGWILSNERDAYELRKVGDLARFPELRWLDLFHWVPNHSRNNRLLALITFGEGWHNNNQFSMGSCRQGFRWREIDLSCVVSKLRAIIGIARDLRPFGIPAPRLQGAK